MAQISPRIKGRKLTTPKKFRHLIFAFPVNEDNPFPVDVLSYHDNPFGLHIRPNKESDSARLTLNPVFGNTEPLFLRGVGVSETFKAQEYKGWNFVALNDEPWHRKHLYNQVHLNEVLEAARHSISLSSVSNLGDHHGSKDVNYRYAHYAVLRGRGSLMLDMMRYDNFSLATSADAEELVRSENDRNGLDDLHIVKLSEGAQAIWTPDRHFSGIELIPLRFDQLPESVRYV